MDLSKAFDSITHDLIIAKMHAYGFSIVTVKFLYSFLQRHKQNVRINNTHLSSDAIIWGSSRFHTWATVIQHIY